MHGRPIRDYIIQVKDLFERETDAKDVQIYLTSVTEDSFQQKKRAPVVALPLINSGHDIRIGDEIYFKHTVLKNTWVAADKIKYSEYLVNFDEDLYRVPPDMIWGYRRGDEFFVTDNWLVVEPIKLEEEVRPSGIILPGFDKEVDNLGTITHIGKKMEELGFKVGDDVVWSKNSEYEVKFGKGKKYRMHYTWIIGKYGC